MRHHARRVQQRATHRGEHLGGPWVRTSKSNPSPTFRTTAPPFRFPNSPNNDGHGHGTHCAGTAGGLGTGVAPEADIKCLKALSDSGTGNIINILNAMEVVEDWYDQNGGPAELSMSLVSTCTSMLSCEVSSMVVAAKELSDKGIFVVVAAGNAGYDARWDSPAAGGALPGSAITTVGASTLQDDFAIFSNYGPAVGIVAPVRPSLLL